jgi:hypothetical protein
MKELSKAQDLERDAIAKKLEDGKELLEQAIVVYNQSVAALFEKVSEAAAKYNEIVTEAEEFRESVHGDIDGYMGERSEKWLEGDRGQAYDSWRTEWESSIDQISLSVDNPDELYVEGDFEEGDNLLNLPTNPDGV